MDIARPSSEVLRLSSTRPCTRGCRVSASDSPNGTIGPLVAGAPILNWPFQIRNAESRKCLTIHWASRENNAKAIQYTCEIPPTYPPDDYWTLKLAGYDVGGQATYHSVNSHTNLCLTR